MRILIGTPIHEVKDYCMERWLISVSRLKYPADLLMIDNSPTTGYLKKIKGYCQKHQVKNYKIIHINTTQEASDLGIDIRIELSQERIRQEVLSNGYEAWFSWECDQLLPTDVLDKLINLMESGGFMIVAHNAWFKNGDAGFNMDMGCTLISRECLKKYCLSPKYSLKNIYNRWQGQPEKYKDRVVLAGGKCLDVIGVIGPIYHL